ncbi:MAG: CARDB domain-containing protein [Saprospiraceae bacterium]
MKSLYSSKPSWFGLTTMFLLSFTLTVQAQTFDKVYGAGIGVKIHPTQNLEFNLLASTPQGLESLHLNANGDLISRNLISIPLQRTIPFEDGILAVGKENFDFRIRKTSLDDQLVFDQTIPGINADLKVLDIIQTSDQGFAISGYFLEDKIFDFQGNTFTILSKNAFLLKINSDGNLQFLKTYNNTNDAADNAEGNKILQRPDGSFVLATSVLGYSTSPSVESEVAEIWILDQNGDLIQKITTPLLSSYYNQAEIKAFANTSDGGFIATGIYGFISTRCYPYRNHVLKFNSNNELEWDNRNIGPTNYRQLPGGPVYGVLEKTSGEYMVLGITPGDFCNQGPGYPASIQLYNNQGENFASGPYPPLVDNPTNPNANIDAIDFKATPDGNYVLTATKNGEIHVYKFDASVFANNQPDLELAIRTTNNQPAIYSNFTVEFEIKNNGTADAHGIIVQLPLPQNLVYVGGNEAIATAGTFLPYNINQWTLPILRPGEKHYLRVNYFNLSTQPKFVYGQVVFQEEPDFDSTPGGWQCCSPVEDDEAAIEINSASTALPDLSLAVSAIAVSGPGGFRTSLLYDLRNNGLADVNSDVKTSLYFSTDNQWQASDLMLSSETDNSIPAGSFVQNQLWYNVPLSYAPGVYYLILRTDDDETIQESNENNNLVISPFQILPSADLSWDGVNFLPSIVGLGASFNADVLFKNIGNASAGNFIIETWLSEDDNLDVNTDIKLYDRTIFGLAPDAGGTTSFAVHEIPDNIPIGNYHLIFVADASDAIPEVDENNNIFVSPIEIITQGYPDLKPTNILNINSSLSAGDLIVPEVVYSNLGTDVAYPPFNIALYLSTDANLDPTDQLLRQEILPFPFIIHSAYSRLFQPFAIPSSTQTGNYFIIAKMDSNDELVEIDETNNLFSYPVHIEGIPQAGVDLELNILGPTNNPPNFSYFTTVAKIENKGTATASNIVILMPHAEGAVYQGGNEYLASKGTYELYGNQSWRISSLAPGEAATLTMNFSDFLLKLFTSLDLLHLMVKM